MVKTEIDCSVKFSYFSVLDVIHRSAFFCTTCYYILVSSKPSSRKEV